MNNKLLYPPRKFRREPTRIDAATLLRLILLPLLFSASLSVAQAQSGPCSEPQDNPYTLGVNEVIIKRDIIRNQRHVYRLPLFPQQFVHLVVEQKGIDLVVRLLDKNKQLITERDSPNATVGPEAISVVASSTEDYYLEVCANKTQAAGSYKLTVEGPRQSSNNDQNRVDAERLFMAGRKLTAQRQPDTLVLAIAQFTKARQLWRDMGYVREEGYALCGIGEAYRFLRNFEYAKKNLDEALSRLSAAQDPSGQAYVLSQLGAAHRDLDDPRRALSNYEDALALRRRIGDLWGEALIHNNVGYLYSEMGEQQASITNSELALPIWREVKDNAMEANTRNNIAKAHLDLGNLTTAFQKYEELLEYCKNNQPCSLEPFIRNSLGVIHDTWGEPTEALTEYYRARQLFQQSKNRREEAKVLDNIGMVFAGIGEPSTGLEHFYQALKIRETESENAGEEITRSNIGYAQMLLHNHADALKHLARAQQLSRSSRNQRFEAYTLMRIGAVHRAGNEKEKAIAAYKDALEIQKIIEDRRGQAITLDKIAELYSLMDQPGQAINNYQQAISLWSYVGDQQGEALSLYGIAQVQRKLGKLPDARDKIVEAIEKVESLRTRMTSHRLRMSYLESRRDFYELEIDVRMSLYNQTKSRTDLELALFASERAHARNLLDVLTESHTDIRQGVDPELLALERTQRALLGEKLSQYQDLLSKKHTAAQRSAAQNEIQTISRSFDQTQAEIRKRSPRYAALTQPQPLRPAQIQQLLDARTVLLEYTIGEERSYLWAVTRSTIKAYPLPGRAEIEKAINSFRESITAWEPKQTSTNAERLERLTKLRADYEKYQQRARDLSNMVLKPAASLITNKRLVIVADGMLHYISFAALPVPTATRRSSAAPVPLVTKHEIVYQPSASVLALIREMPHPVTEKTVAVFADPVFEKRDKRVLSAASESSAGPIPPAYSTELRRALRDAGDIGGVDGPLLLERLEYARGEADAIVATVPFDKYMKAVDFEASRTNFLSQNLKQYAVVHIATHAIINGQNPELSGVVFSLVDKRGNAEDGFLRLNDIYNLNLPIEMVVLSACSTGVGKPVKGEGLIGLTRGFIHAGAARVVASLWKVDDEATAELMRRFYHYKLKEKMPAAAALRRAQLDQMAVRPDPYYWAGFVLQGEWK